MVDVERWRAIGLELAFDPAKPPARLSATGRRQLQDDLANLDPERLLAHYPRGPDGRLPLGEMVLLAPAEITLPPRAPRGSWLFATSPAKRNAPQVVTLAVSTEIGRNFQHRWDMARWLWDARAAKTPELERWGTQRLPVATLQTLAPPVKLPRRLADDDRAALAIALVRDGRWRDALALYGITHALDDLPYGSCQPKVDPKRWDDALAAGMQGIAPWRFAQALARMQRNQTEWRLFNFPGQQTTMKYCVVLTRRNNTPHLAVAHSGSNTRAADVDWRWPPDLAMIVRGDRPASVAGRAPVAATSKTSTEGDLLAQLIADPGDLDARRIYADLLAQRPDPAAAARGELITLQLVEAERGLDAKAAKRVRELVKAHWRTWLLALAPLVEKPVFERGFLAACTFGSTRTPYDAWAEVLAPEHRPELACLRDVSLAGTFPAAVAAKLLASDQLPSLQRLSVDAVLAGIVERRVAVLELRFSDGQRVADRLGAPLAVVPDELHLTLERPQAFAIMLRDCLPLARGLPARIDRLVLTSSKHAVELSRDAERALTVVTAKARAYQAALLLGLAATIAQQPRGAVTRIVVCPTTPLSARERRELEQAATQAGAALVVEA